MRRTTNYWVKAIGMVWIFGILGIEFVRADDLVLPRPPPPKMERVDDGVYAYFENYYISLVVVAKDGVIVTDPGGDQRARRLNSQIRKLTDAPITTVIYSHDHYDHARGGHIFKEQGARFISHQDCLPVLGNDPLGKTVLPDITYSGDFHSIQLGSKSIELHHFGPSDGRCMSIVYLPGQKIMQAVDVHLPGMLVSLDHLYSHEYLGVLNTLRQIQSNLELDQVVTGHIPGSSPEAFEEDLAFVEALYSKVLAGMKNGQSLAQLKKSIKIPEISDWQLYDENLSAHVERMFYAINHGG